jgi:hypothetical protein
VPGLEPDPDLENLRLQVLRLLYPIHDGMSALWLVNIVNLYLPLVRFRTVYQL